MKRAILFILALLPALVYGQQLVIQNKSINIVDLVDAPDVDSIGITPDSSDVFYNVTVRVYRTTYVPSIDSTITLIDTIPFVYVLGTELDNVVYNAIWNAEAVFAHAEANLFNEPTTEANLVKINPVLVVTRGQGYLAYNKSAFLPQFVGYWRLVYNSVNFDIRINEDGTVNEVELAPGGGSIIPKVGGIDGTVQIYHGYRRLVFNNLVPGDTPLKLSASNELRTKFVRRDKSVTLTYRKQSIQDIPYVP